MDQISSAIKPVFRPLQDLYNKAFNANKFVAGIGLSIIITTALFFVMVILISLGDSGIKEDTSVKLADVVMPERQIDTFITEVDKPEKLEQELKLMLLPKDSADDGSAFLEIRAGAGGDEASIFAGDLFRMYTRLAERERWNLEVIDIKQSEQGGLKEVVAKLA